MEQRFFMVADHAMQHKVIMCNSYKFHIDIFVLFCRYYLHQATDASMHLLILDLLGLLLPIKEGRGGRPAFALAFWASWAYISFRFCYLVGKGDVWINKWLNLWHSHVSLFFTKVMNKDLSWCQLSYKLVGILCFNYDCWPS